MFEPVQGHQWMRPLPTKGIEIPLEQLIGIGVEVKRRKRGELHCRYSVQPKARRATDKCLNLTPRELVWLWIGWVKLTAVSCHKISLLGRSVDGVVL